MSSGLGRCPLLSTVPVCSRDEAGRSARKLHESSTLHCDGEIKWRKGKKI